MGDRGNIAVLHSDKSQVWLYGHWAGCEMPGLLQAALVKGKDRWNDEMYLNKIIFCQTIGSCWDDASGWGISGSIGDSEHPILVVDMPRQRVFTMPEQSLTDGKVPDGFEPDPRCVWTFEEYCALKQLPW